MTDLLDGLTPEFTKPNFDATDGPDETPLDVKPETAAPRPSWQRSLKARKPRGNKAEPSPSLNRKEPTKISRRKGQFVEPLTGVYVGIGMAIMSIDMQCGQAVVEAGPNCAKAMDDLAQKNDAVWRAVYSITQTSLAGAVIFAHMPIILAVIGHHRPELLGNMLGAFTKMPQAESTDDADA